MRSQIVAITTVMALGLAVTSWLVFGFGRTSEAGALDGFAQCLTQRGFTMYGAYWCPHCQNEKKRFGDSFTYVNYVECTAEPKKCLAANISGYPTWVGPKGLRLEGEQGTSRLSKASKCSLPVSK